MQLMLQCKSILKNNLKESLTRGGGGVGSLGEKVKLSQPFDTQTAFVDTLPETDIILDKNVNITKLAS